ncbi:hypothetical protein M1B72_00925 [Geomonas paludis]|uniref:Uncharacterized protein n=1 Tax=Geomonas paludis TaxID=2740185 RepID=A0A6V8MQT9_9BACT|nr:hypothetical protein [Geomonas paludis]UPU36297.1 hypothetical protein M1B72_00925 [Geomonas paludis]GFO62083.1 hypothetical protein GMPD_00020 [Geomonas paludis]
MAGSRQDHLRRDPFQRPSLTPGPLGHNDAAAPHRQNLLVADTPGPLGRNDAADPSRQTRERKASQLPKKLAKLSLEQVQVIALEITTYFEGGGYAALAADNDQQVTSFGLLQWNFGQNTLGPLLRKMYKSAPVSFDNCFCNDDAYKEFKSAIVTNDQAGQVRWARAKLKTDRKEWEGAFRKLAQVDEFNKIQAHEAISAFHPAVMQKIKALRALYPREFLDIEVRTYVALYDLSVQQYSLGQVLENINKYFGKRGSKSQNEIMRAVVIERGRTARKQYRADCISRRMGILTAASFQSNESGYDVERKNPKLSLLIKYEGWYVEI